MRLRKSQKEAVLSWIAEGLQTDEINSRAREFESPFSVSRQQVDFYRERSSVDLEALRKAGNYDALTEGLARKDERVRRLQMLAALMENDLLGGSLWLEQVKMIGGGEWAREVEYEEFNKAEVESYRGVLDDIAKEMGHRRQGVDVKVDNAELDATIEQELARLAAGGETGATD